MKKTTVSFMVSMLLTLLSFMQVKANCPGVGINVAPASTPSSQICTGTSLTITGTYTGDAPYTMQLLSGTTPILSVSGVTVTSVSFVLPSGSSGTYKITILPHGSCTGQKFSTPNTPYVDLTLNAYYLNIFGANCYTPGGYDLGLQGDDGSGIIYSLYRSNNLVTTLTGSTDIGPDFLPVDFGNQTTPGVYSIVGFNPSTGCNALQGQTGNQSLTINPLPVKPTITGTNPLCVQSTNIFQISTVTGESYVWTISTTGAAYTSSNNKATITASGAGNALLTVTATNSCGSTVSDVKSVSIVDYRNILTISGLNYLQNGTSVAYLSNSVSGVTYNWSVTGTGSGSFASLENATTFTGTASGLATLKVQGTGVCNTNIATYNVTVLSQPCTAGSGGSNTYTIGANNSNVNTVTGNKYDLGSVGTTTTISGTGLRLDGIYHLLGNVIVNGGSPTITGAKLYAEPSVGITFSGSNLTINGSLLSSTCPVATTAGSNALNLQSHWSGVGVVNSSLITAINNATLTGALYAIYIDGTSTTSFYIDKVSFYNNRISIFDNNRINNVSGLKIKNSTFTGNYLGMHRAIDISTSFSSSNAYVYIQNNTMYNFTNLGVEMDCAGEVTGNNLYNNKQGNIYVLANNTTVSQNTIQTGFVMGTVTGPSLGITAQSYYSGNVTYNLITQGPGSYTWGAYALYGNSGIYLQSLFATTVANVSLNTISGQNLHGIYNFGPNINTIISGNILTNNYVGVYSELQGATYSGKISCNNFDGTGTANSTGIYFLCSTAVSYPNLGASKAWGNKFLNYGASGSYGIYNNANSVLGYYLGGESQPTSSSASGKTINFGTSALSSGCSGQSYSTGYRMAADETTAMSVSQKQDNLKYRDGSTSVLRGYQADIMAHYQEANDLEGLGAYTKTIVNCNREAYYSLSIYLIYAHYSAGNKAASELWKVAALQPDPKNEDIKAQVKYFDLITTGHIRAFDKLSNKDSIGLAQIANSGTSIAKSALQQLQLSYPAYTSNTDIIHTYDYSRINCDSQNPKARKSTQLETYGGALENAVPNPATNETVISYTLVDANSHAAIEIHDVVTGKLIKYITLSEIDKSAQSLNLNVSGYASGVYSYRLWVNGKVADTKKLVVIN